MFHNELLLDGMENAVKRIIDRTSSLDAFIAIGAPVRWQGRLFNTALLLQRGKLLGIVPKTHLPNYKEFYEKRHFASGHGIRNASSGLWENHLG